jgi:hypothetical protein
MDTLKNNRWLTVFIIILLLANIVTLVLLWSGYKKNELEKIIQNPTGSVFQFVTTALQLNEQQQKAYAVLRDEHRAGQKDLQDSIKKAKDNFFELLKLPATNDSILKMYSSRELAFQQQLEIFTFKHFQQVKALCTTAQQIKFDNVIQEALKRMGNNRPPRPDGPPPPGIGGEHGPPPCNGEENYPPPNAPLMEEHKN